MKKGHQLLGLILLMGFLFSSCLKKPDEVESEVVLGELSVELDATESRIRTQESLIGNFVADALMVGMEAYDLPCDLVLVNAGTIRYNAETRPTAIYPKGNFTTNMLDEMLPFTENKMVVVQVTGLQLKEILERSLALLPQGKGSFLCLSKDIRLSADLSKQAQVLDVTVEPNKITVPGERILSIYFKEALVTDSQELTIGVPDYIANANDGFTTFLSLSADKKQESSLYLTNVVREQVIISSPINPSIEGRIIF